MAEWPAAPNVIGKRVPRLDGLHKASGKAKYPSDVRPEGTLFGVMLYSPHAHAKVKSIETVESFDTGERGVPHAFHQNDGLMCGYCTPGFVTACKALLDANPNPSLEDVKRGLDGNICRCGTYIGVFQAALDAAKAMKGA